MVDRNIIWHFRFRHRGGTESRGHLFVEFGQKTVTQIPPFEISVTVHFIKRECLVHCHRNSVMSLFSNRQMSILARASASVSAKNSG